MILNVTITSDQLAALAHDEAMRHASRTPERRAASALWTALITTSSVDSAKRALGGFVPGDVEQAAIRLLHRLAITAREGTER